MQLGHQMQVYQKGMEGDPPSGTFHFLQLFNLQFGQAYLVSFIIVKCNIPVYVCKT